MSEPYPVYVPTDDVRDVLDRAFHPQNPSSDHPVDVFDRYVSTKGTTMRAIAPPMTLRTDDGTTVELSICECCGAAVLEEHAAGHLDWHRRLQNVEQIVTDPWPGAARAARERMIPTPGSSPWPATR